MRVSSPIGELPFEPTRLGLREGHIAVDGRMGAWPAHVVIGLEDVPSLIRLVRTPLLAAVAVAALAAVTFRRRARR